MAKKRSRTKRGYSKNILITFETKQAVIWKVYTKRVEQQKIIKLNKKYEYTEKKQLYHYFENIINYLYKNCSQFGELLNLLDSGFYNSPFSLEEQLSYGTVLYE